jgi:hypothetical protein
VHHPDPRPGDLDDALDGELLTDRGLVHVPVDADDGRAESLQLAEERERGEVACVEDQIRRAAHLDATAGQHARPARQVRVGDDGDGRRTGA